MKRNQSKLEFIKQYYLCLKKSESLQDSKNCEFYENWINKTLRKVPKHLYKYRAFNPNSLSSLKNDQAWFSKPSLWNDPIDITAHYDLKKDTKELSQNIDNYILNFAKVFIDKYLNSFLKDKKQIDQNTINYIYSSIFKGKDRLESKEIISTLTPIIGEPSAKQFAFKAQEVLSSVLNNQVKTQLLSSLKSIYSLNDVRNQMISLSLSETYNNNHQWAIYADGGKGFCIGYKTNPQNAQQRDLILELLPIYYGKKRVFSITRLFDEMLQDSAESSKKSKNIDREERNQFIAMLTKEPEWSGEQEWRYILKDTNLSEKGKLVDFDMADSVYIGDNMSPDSAKILTEIAKEKKLKIFSRRLDKTGSLFNYERI